MVFGKKKQPPTGTLVPVLSPAVKVTRTKASYRRPIPPASVIRSTEQCSVDACKACGGELENITTHDRYVEDISLSGVTPGYQAKRVTKYTVERGVCRHCSKVTSGYSLSDQVVTLGPNVSLLVCHLVSVGGISYTQTINILLTLYGIVVSSGEIANILYTKSIQWHPAYEQLGADIRAPPVVHVDETPWPIQANDRRGHAWVLSDANSPKVCFALEQSRGAVYAQTLFGQDTNTPFSGVRVSDDYALYRNLELPGDQQLCWAHLYRCIRDLRYNTNVPKEQLPYVSQWYTGFAGIYQDLRSCLAVPYDAVTRKQQADKLWQRLQALIDGHTPQEGEPNKLTKLKAQLQRAGQDRLFICLLKDAPCDNNKAERDLRQLVLKRNRSFGSNTERGAKALATILSLCTTMWRTAQPTRYFSMLASLAVRL